MGQNKKPHASRRGDKSPGYTAGPWDHYDYNDPKYPTIKIEDDHGAPIAYIDRSDRGPAESLANARLIAVAPDLLKIVKMVKERCDLWPDDTKTAQLIYEIETAISTAEGQHL